MPRIMITCPTTGRAIYTGMSMDEDSFEQDSKAFSNTGAPCPECGELHPWQRQDAFLERER
ncbi:MAG TPA: hypothetical protein VF762_22400 [Blastocatellia bacterium]